MEPILLSKTLNRMRHVVNSISTLSSSVPSNFGHADNGLSVRNIASRIDELSRLLESDASLANDVRSQTLLLLPVMEKHADVDPRYQSLKIDLFRLVAQTFQSENDDVRALPWLEYCSCRENPSMKSASCAIDLLRLACLYARLNRPEDAVHAISACEDVHAANFYKLEPSVWMHLFEFARQCMDSDLCSIAKRFVDRVAEAVELSAGRNVSVQLPTREEVDRLLTQLEERRSDG